MEKKIRQVKNRKYLLSSRVLPYKVIKTFALQMRPQEQNIIYDVQGNDIFLYDTEIEASKSQGNDEENHYYLLPQNLWEYATIAKNLL